MWTLIQEQLISTFLPIIATALATWLTARLGKMFHSIEDRFNIDINDKLEEQTKRLVKTSVTAVQESYVKELKKSGKFSQEQHAEALERALAIIKAELKTVISQPVSDEKLKAEVEVAVAEVKNGG
jgi:hypothetical protein